MKSLGQDPSITQKFVDDALKNTDIKLSETILDSDFCCRLNVF